MGNQKVKKPILRKVVGYSMAPALQPGDVVFALPLKVRADDVVVASQAGREVIKRVAKIDQNGYFLVGDNMTKSTDSRKHGSVSKQNTLGRVVAKLPSAVQPVQPKSNLAKYLSLVLAAMMIVLVVANLSRIGDLVVALNGAVPGGQTAAAWATIIVALCQLLAIPYLAMLKLSPLGHIVSGVLSVLAPLLWSMIAIWNLATDTSIGLFANYVATPASWLLLALLLLWLTASYFNLYFRDFNKQVERLRKHA